MATAAEERAAAALPAQQGTDQVRVKRETIQAVLDQCQRALKLLEEPCGIVVDDAGFGGMDGPPLSSSASDSEADELCKMVQSKVDSESFLEKLGTKNLSVSPSDFDDDTTTWDMISRADLWETKQFGACNKEDQDEYVLVNQEDIVEGIACFMAAYLLSLKETKELTPNQLQEALCKTLSVKKKKSKLRKAWEGSQVIYNVASWGATAIGIYQNPAILKAASVTLWSSCRVVSKLF